MIISNRTKNMWRFRQRIADRTLLPDDVIGGVIMDIMAVARNIPIKKRVDE